MTTKNFLNIILSFILLLAFVGIPVTKSFCSVGSCKKDLAGSCCSEKEKKSCQQTEYIQLDSDWSYIEASIKIPDSSLFFVAPYLVENSVTVLTKKHSELSYDLPLIPIDIPIRVRCFRI